MASKFAVDIPCAIHLQVVDCKSLSGYMPCKSAAVGQSELGQVKGTPISQPVSEIDSETHGDSPQLSIMLLIRTASTRTCMSVSITARAWRTLAASSGRSGTIRLGSGVSWPQTTDCRSESDCDDHSPSGTNTATEVPLEITASTTCNRVVVLPVPGGATTVISLKVPTAELSAEASNGCTTPPWIILRFSAIGWRGHPGMRLKAATSFLAATITRDLTDSRSSSAVSPKASISSSLTVSAT